jgi:hypothetical protein
MSNKQRVKTTELIAEEKLQENTAARKSDSVATVNETAKKPVASLERENAMVLNWADKRSEEELPLKITFELQENSSDNKVFFSINENETNNKNHGVLSAAILCKAFGSGSFSYCSNMLNQTINGMFSKTNAIMLPDLLEGTIEALAAMNPADHIEGQLCARLLTLNNQINEFMRRSVECEYHDAIDRNVNRVAKLTRLYNETLESLNKYRRKGEQKVTVQHVHVNDGGKAIVAAEVTPGGGFDKKTEV